MKIKRKTVFEVAGILAGITGLFLIGIGVVKLGTGVMLTGIFTIGVGIFFWQIGCFRVVDEVEMEGEGVPTQGIVKRFGRPVRAVEPGLLHIWWPIEWLGVFVPTIVYLLNYNEVRFTSFSGKEIDTTDLRYKDHTENAKPVFTEITVHLWLPKVSEDSYNIPDLATGQIRKIKGEELLIKRLYYGIPQKTLLSSEKMALRYKKATFDAVRAIIGKHTYKWCREQKVKLEMETKEWITKDPTNLYTRDGIPAELLDIVISGTHSDDDVEEALYTREVAETRAGAVKAQITARTDAGMDPDLAGISVSGVEGKGMTIEQLRDWSIFQSMSRKRRRI